MSTKLFDSCGLLVNRSGRGHGGTVLCFYAYGNGADLNDQALRELLRVLLAELTPAERADVFARVAFAEGVQAGAQQLAEAARECGGVDVDAVLDDAMRSFDATEITTEHWNKLAEDSQ